MAQGVCDLEYRYQVDVEPGWDYVYVVVDTTGTLPTTEGVDVASYTGPASGTGSLTLTAGTSLPSQAGPIAVKFCVISDGAYSDEDGDYATSCGAFGVDDIHVWNTDCGGAIDGLSTFETGNDGWVTETLCPGTDDLSRLAPVSALPWPPGYTGGCDLGDSVLAFYDPATGGHPLYQDSYAVSPWIDLRAAGKTGLPGRFIELGGYYDLPLLNYIFVQALAQWYPDTCSVTGATRVSPLTLTPNVYYFAGVPTCASVAPRRIDLRDVLPSTAEQVRIAVGVINYCRYYSNCTQVTNSTPWFDDIRFGVTTTNRIQTLVDAAAPGDTVLIGAGTYWGPGNRDITFRGKEIVLLAPAGPESTVIDCQGAARGFIIDSGEDSTLVIDGFTVRNGKAPVITERPYMENGGAVLVSGLAHPTLKNCRLESSLAAVGGGAYVGSHCGIRMEGCTVRADSVTSYGYYDSYGTGAGVHGADPSTVAILNSIIQDNRRGFGVRGDGTTQVDSCLIESNHGAGIYIGEDGWVRDCTVGGNSGAGLQLQCVGQWNNGSSAVVQRCVISGNQGYGIVGCGAGAIEDCTVNGNGAGGISVFDTTIRRCLVRDNNGTGVYLGGGLLEACEVTGNIGIDAGGVFASNSWWQSSTIRDCVITGNRAPRGGGVAFSWDSIVPNSGQMIGCTVSGNRAEFGGGVSVTYQYLLDIRQSIITGNCADSLGADVYTRGDSTTVTFHCCAFDSSGIGGPGHFVYDGPQVFTDPLFCSPASCFATPTTAGDYHLTTGSPCLPESSPCDSLIGALGLGCSTTGVPDDKPPLPTTAMLRAYPNPFRADVTLLVAVPAGTTGAIEIFDVRGRRVRAFEARTGETALRWDGRSEQGVSLPQGLYFVHLRAGAEFRTQRVILLH